MLFQTRGYVIYSASGSFFVPLVVTLFFYANIFVVIRGRMRKNRAARAKLAMSTAAGAASAESRPLESCGKSAVSTTITVVDVEMSSLSAPNVELDSDDEENEVQIKTDMDPVANAASSSSSEEDDAVSNSQFTRVE